MGLQADVSLLNWVSNKNLGVDSILGHFAFVGWVEPTPDFVGFRCTQPNLHSDVVIAKCETQQRPISKLSPKSFYFDQAGRFFGQRRRSYETSINWGSKSSNLHQFLVGAASSRDYAMIAIKRLFFAAGSRSHEELM